MKLSDYVVETLVKYGMQDVFMISGGGAMHLNDSVGKNPSIRYWCNHHEQATAIGAEGYSRVTGKLAAAIVTTGPGGTNTITGVIGQWLDSIPVLYISGQVKFDTTIASCPELGLRQLGDQEINIVDIVRPITKYAEMVRRPQDIRWMLEKAIFTAMDGRRGPVWVDIPLDIQAAEVDVERLEGFQPESCTSDMGLTTEIETTLDWLRQAKRPLIVAGHGIRFAGAENLLLELLERTGIPVVTSFNGFDLLDSSHPCYIGRPGTIGTRAGNFAVQNADVILFLGTRNNIRQISYNYPEFAEQAKRIVVDIDKSELSKPTLRPGLAVHSDVRLFLEGLLPQVGGLQQTEWQEWLAWLSERKERYPIVLEEYKNSAKVQPYYFMQVLSECLASDACVVTGNGTASVAYFQAGKVKKGQRVFWNSGCASMGYDFPAAIGACIGRGKKDVVCLAGDGSLQMNIQELATVAYHQLPVKLFVLNNDGYSSIRQTQDNLFSGHHVACGPDSGVGFPNIVKVAEAYGIPAGVISSQENLKQSLQGILRCSGPFVCEVKLEDGYTFMPKVASRRDENGKIISTPLDDMYPFLSRAEMQTNRRSD